MDVNEVNDGEGEFVRFRSKGALKKERGFQRRLAARNNESNNNHCRTVRLDFPANTEFEVKFRWFYEASLDNPGKNLRIRFRHDEDNYVFVTNDPTFIEKLLTHKYANIQLQAAPPISPKVLIVIHNLNKYMDPKFLLSDQVANPRRLPNDLILAEWIGQGTPPSYIYSRAALNRSYKIALYKPPHRRCYKCQRWGHVAFKCFSKSHWCVVCAKAHPSHQCYDMIKKHQTVALECINCKTPGVTAAHADCRAKAAHIASRRAPASPITPHDEAIGLPDTSCLNTDPCLNSDNMVERVTLGVHQQSTITSAINTSNAAGVDTICLAESAVSQPPDS
nr:uncharacterized protein LOC128701747 isoform X1 [Cherax quadricarinatus]